MTAKIEASIIFNFKKMKCGNGETESIDGRLSLDAVAKRNATQI
jgi:hypothetical protein